MLRSRTLRVTALAAALLASACHSPEPATVLDVKILESYWVIDAPVGQEQFVAPALRVEVRNKSPEALAAVELKVRFFHGNTDWGGDWRRLTSSRKRLAPGEAVVEVLRGSGRYHFAGPPETMFANSAFEDSRAEVFASVGASGFVKFAAATVERRIGSKSVPADAR